MPRYRFALSSLQQVREVGSVQTDSFTDAFTAISEHVEAHEGDTLEIGVAGFPPARFECVWSMEQGAGSWKPAGLLAA